MEMSDSSSAQQRSQALSLIRTLRQQRLDGAGSESEENLIADLLAINCPLSVRYSSISNVEQIIALNCTVRYIKFYDYAAFLCLGEVGDYRFH